MFKLFFGLVMVVVLWVILKVLFVSAPGHPLDDSSPGLIAQAWNESPICTIVSIIGFIIFGLFFLASGSDSK